MSELANNEFSDQVFFISGAAKRIGAAIAEGLHARGANVVIHYRSSQDQAEALASRLNQQRNHSASLLQADLGNIDLLTDGMVNAIEKYGRLDGLINNASSFYATPLAQAEEKDWDALFDSNLKGAYFLSKAAVPWLQKTHGSIINITDIFAQQPLYQHNLYCAAKAGLLMLSKSLALELAPDIRVNAIAPGAILWPESSDDQTYANENKLSRIPLNRIGSPADITAAVCYLLSASYVTGQVINVDGGRGLT